LEKRVIENGTAVTITVGETAIPATVNVSKAAQDLISKANSAVIKQRKYKPGDCMKNLFTKKQKRKVDST
jgi:hypothetical protein